MSKTVKMDLFLAKIQEIISEKPIYKRGMDGRNRQCDCIGLIIGAIRRAGGTWSGTHGSNYAARNEMQTMESPPRLEVGAAVYKYHEPGQAGWNLPVTYKNHPDQNDYYHVGVVLSVSPLKIAHCTSWSGGSGIKIDTVIGKWRRGGRLKKVDYAAEPPQEGADTMIGYINLPPTSNVFHRISPSTTSDWWGRIYGGERVESVSENGEWTRVRYGGHDGYVMSKFITTDASAQPDPMPPDVPSQDSANKEEPVQDLTVYTSPDGTVETEPLVVTVTGGGTARMRKKPDTNALILSNIRDGVYVQGIRRGEDGWYQIKYNGKIGWMMEQYLRVDGEASPGDSDPPDVVDVDKAALLTELEGLNKRQAVIIAALRGVM